MDADLSVADQRGTGAEAEAGVEHAPVLDGGVRDALPRTKLPPQHGDLPALQREDEPIGGNRHVRVRDDITDDPPARHDREAGPKPQRRPAFRREDVRAAAAGRRRLVEVVGVPVGRIHVAAVELPLNLQVVGYDPHRSVVEHVEARSQAAEMQQLLVDHERAVGFVRLPRIRGEERAVDRALRAGPAGDLHERRVVADAAAGERDPQLIAGQRDADERHGKPVSAHRDHEPLRRRAGAARRDETRGQHERDQPASESPPQPGGAPPRLSSHLSPFRARGHAACGTGARHPLSDVAQPAVPGRRRGETNRSDPSPVSRGREAARRTRTVLAEGRL